LIYNVIGLAKPEDGKPLKILDTIVTEENDHIKRLRELSTAVLSAAIRNNGDVFFNIQWDPIVPSV